MGSRKRRVPRVRSRSAASNGFQPSGSGEHQPPSFRLVDDEYVVLSFPVKTAPPTPLADAEKLIFEALMAGRSNRQIAEERGRALRTVTNQVAAIFQKLGVRSRSELIAKYSEALRD